MQNQTKAILYAGFVILCWSTVATAFKIALSELTYIELLLVSSITATIIYFIAILIEGKWRLLTESLQNKKVVFQTTILGLVNPLLYYLILFKAYSLLPAQIAQPINCSWQILLPLLAVIFLKRKMTSFQWIGLFISFIGIIFISAQGNFSEIKTDSIPGVLLALSSAFVWGFYWVLKIGSKLDPVIELFINFLTASLLLIIYFGITGIPVPSLKGLSAGIYVGTFEMGIAFLCWAKALKLSNNTAMLSQLTYLAPFFSLILIHFILGEQIYWTTLTGLPLIIGGILLGNWKTIKKPE